MSEQIEKVNQETMTKTVNAMINSMGIQDPKVIQILVNAFKYGFKFT